MLPVESQRHGLRGKLATHTAGNSLNDIAGLDKASSGGIAAQVVACFGEQV
jgi:hypothetical protein